MLNLRCYRPGNHQDFIQLNWSQDIYLGSVALLAGSKGGILGFSADGRWLVGATAAAASRSSGNLQ